ncbi:ribosome biogenesis GTPase YlqF [bacterium CPR1]|nr:ribosome biogenesis GTPase YlqF [bacterium CPR1]
MTDSAYSWFPGHMRRAMRRLEQDLEMADAVLFVLEARLPESSRHPELEAMLRKRGRLLFYVLAKADLADPAATESWLTCLREQGHQAIALNAVKGSGAGALTPTLEKLAARIAEQRARKKLNPRDPRLVVVGIPNVGKSSLLNRLVGRKRAMTGDRPGVTRGKQWVVAAGRWQVMDTPGILYPRIEGMDRLACLAATGCVREEAIPSEEAAAYLLARLVKLGQSQAFLSGEDLPGEPFELLEETGRRKGFLLKGARVDTERTARWVLQVFREGRAGRITLELPPNACTTGA